jgi:hypothetical protein
VISPEPWLTKREVAARLRVSTRTVTRLGFPYIRVGGQNRYLMSEVEAALGRPVGIPGNVVTLRKRGEEVG